MDIQSMMRTMNEASHFSFDLKCCSSCKTKAGEKKFPVCGRCKTVAYCNGECQKKAWPQHKNECKRRAELRHYKEIISKPQPEMVSQQKGKFTMFNWMSDVNETICCVSQRMANAPTSGTCVTCEAMSISQDSTLLTLALGRLSLKQLRKDTKRASAENEAKTPWLETRKFPVGKHSFKLRVLSEHDERETFIFQILNGEKLTKNTDFSPLGVGKGDFYRVTLFSCDEKGKTELISRLRTHTKKYGPVSVGVSTNHVAGEMAGVGMMNEPETWMSKEQVSSVCKTTLLKDTTEDEFVVVMALVEWQFSFQGLEKYEDLSFRMQLHEAHAETDQSSRIPPAFQQKVWSYDSLSKSVGKTDFIAL